MELEGYKEIKKWLAGKADRTKTEYRSCMKIYLKYRGMNPEELIDEIEADRKKPRRERGEVEYTLKQFHEWLKNEKEKLTAGGKRSTGKKGVSPKRANAILGAIRGFYKANGFPIHMKTPKAAPRMKNKKAVLRAEDVKKLVDHAPTLRDKAIILMFFQTGMDISTLCNLNYGDVARGLKNYESNGETPMPIHLVRKKESVEYITFLAKDGIEALQAYLNQRRERKGKMKQDEPLFLKERVHNGDPRISAPLVDKMMRQVAVLSGVVSKEEMQQADVNPARPHALRAAFSSIMKLQGVNDDVVEYWMGHSIRYDAAYFQQRIDEIKEIYQEHSEALSINQATEQVKKLSKEMRAEIGELQMENRHLRKKIAEMEQSQEQQAGEVFIRALEDPEIRDKFISALVEKAAEKDTSLVDAMQQKQNK